MTSDDDTRSSLLLRIRDHDDRTSWAEFTSIYVPVVKAFAIRAGVAAQEVGDLTQEVLLAVAKAVGDFEYDRTRGRFRSWLYQITLHRVRRWQAERRRKPSQTADSDLLEALPARSDDLEQYWEEEWRRQVTEAAVQEAKRHVDLRTFEAFRRYALQDEPVSQVADALGMTVSNVYVCKSRMLARIREVVEDMDGQE